MINEYTVAGVSGKGVFASVIRVTRGAGPDAKPYAIKILRTALDLMRQSGEKEKSVVSLLNKIDPNDRKNIIRLHESFNYEGHLCLVFESLAQNLRQILT